jgi:hypothetical protein
MNLEALHPAPKATAPSHKTVNPVPVPRTFHHHSTAFSLRHAPCLIPHTLQNKPTRNRATAER